MKKAGTNLPKRNYRKYFEILVILIALAILVPQAKGLINDNHVLSSISWAYLVLAVLAYSITPVLAAISIISLSRKSLPLSSSIVVQFASGFTNRLLPSGTGAIATVASFLSKSGIGIAEGLSLAMVNNILGFMAFVIVMLLLRAYDLKNIKSLLPHVSQSLLFVILAVIVVLIIVLVLKNKIRRQLHKSLGDIYSALQRIIQHPKSTFIALLSNCGITALHITCLTLCLKGASHSLPLQITALVFATSIAAITVSPTPSGLGLAELALTASLQTFGLPAAPALAVAVSYRLVTYWVPILPGFLFYRYSRSKNII